MASARSRSPAVRVAISAPALRRAARLPRKNVHPHPAGPQRPRRARPVNLRQKIEQEIRERGPMPFSRYMEMCLYDPELGYYSRPAEKFGKAGDFSPSSDGHAVCGRLLARQFEEMWRVLDKPEQLEILELGPGRGLFAQDVLDWSEKKFPEFYRALRYTLVERSPSLRERLRALFGSRLESGKVQFNDEVDSDASAVARAASESGSAPRVVG